MCVVVLMVSICLCLVIKVMFIFMCLRIKDYWHFLFVNYLCILAIKFNF